MSDTAPDETTAAAATGANAEREPNFLLANIEKKALRWMAARLPRWILPDDLTGLGVLAAIGICIAYQLSNDSVQWLWAVNILLIVHWIGDSMDGTLARVRNIQRPKYGYYLDHLVDAASTILIGLGLGLSPFMNLAIGVMIVVMYLAMSINVYLEAATFGNFSIGYGLIGPTEVRLVLIILNTLILCGVTFQFHIGRIGFTGLDVAGGVIIIGMVVLLGVRAFQNLRTLAKAEPAASRRSHD